MSPIISSSEQTAKLSSTGHQKSLPEPVRTWSGSFTDYPRNETVVTIFERIAKESPDKAALIQGDTELTYGELNKRANRLAHRLRGNGVTVETLVPCSLQRSIEMIVAFLAVLKAGAAYVPIDPAYPEARRDLMLQDIFAHNSRIHSHQTGEAVPIVTADHEWHALTCSINEENPSPIVAPTNLAYVMYTSGSTGRPKGVMVEHRGIVRLVQGTTYCHFGPEETFLQFAPPSFDASTFEIWGALLNGGRLMLMPQETSSLEDLLRAIRQHRVTTLWLTAGLFHLIVDEHPEGLRSLRQLLAGGDVLSARHCRTFFQHAPETTLINGYGPTENTTFTCCHTMRAGDSIPDSVPIGKPVSNTRVYILDRDMNPVTAGTSGELYAAGDGVARGYLNAPDASSEKFLPDPFAGQTHQRMYRTGDLAQWRSDGSIEFLGRVDDQVKILGHRIEPGEIESVIGRHSHVKQACVVVRTDNESKRLAAFFVPSSSLLTSEDLREFVSSQLPQHMVPASFVALPSLPLSQNGKVDRAALAELNTDSSFQETPKDYSENELECTLSQLWQRVLKVRSVGLDDNFFDVGGDSLLLMAMHSSLQKELQVQIPVTDLFEFPTIRKLAQHLVRSESTAVPLVNGNETGQRQREAFARFRTRRSGSGS